MGKPRPGLKAGRARLRRGPASGQVMARGLPRARLRREAGRAGAARIDAHDQGRPTRSYRLTG